MKVLTRIELPQYKETILDDGSQIKAKLESLTGDNRLDISAIKGSDKLTTQANLDRAVSILDQRTQFLINKANSSSYTLPIASASTLGGVKVGSGLSIDGNGVLSASGGDGNPGGSDTQLQYNNAGAFGGISGATTDGTSLILTTGNLKIADIKASGSGGIQVLGNGGTVSALFNAGGGANSTFYGGSKFDYATLSTVPYFDASKNLVSSAVTPTELGYLSGVTSAIQTQLNAKQSAITFGTGVQTALGVNIGSAGAPVLFNGAGGTPSSLTLTNATGLPAASLLAGTLGTGAFIMDTKLTVPQVINTNNAITASGNAATVPVTSKNNIITNNSAATLTITLTTTGAVNMQSVIVQILDFSAVAQTITWVNTENSSVTAPVTSNGSTTLPLTVGFIYNSATSKWRCIASA